MGTTCPLKGQDIQVTGQTSKIIIKIVEAKGPSVIRDIMKLFYPVVQIKDGVQIFSLLKGRYFDWTNLTDQLKHNDMDFSTIKHSLKSSNNRNYRCKDKEGNTWCIATKVDTQQNDHWLFVAHQ